MKHPHPDPAAALVLGARGAAGGVVDHARSDTSDLPLDGGYAYLRGGALARHA
ncbi:MAG: hypothetical protein ACLTG4_08345 [Oscillospiraceae bacterium]